MDVLLVPNVVGITLSVDKEVWLAPRQCVCCTVVLRLRVRLAQRQMFRPGLQSRSRVPPSLSPRRRLLSAHLLFCFLYHLRPEHEVPRPQRAHSGGAQADGQPSQGLAACAQLRRQL